MAEFRLEPWHSIPSLQSFLHSGSFHLVSALSLVLWRLVEAESVIVLVVLISDEYQSAVDLRLLQHWKRWHYPCFLRPDQLLLKQMVGKSSTLKS